MSATVRTNVGRINAILLLVVAPIVVRFWIEAVVWRLQRGPQMLGFSLAHAGAGWFTLPLIVSFLSTFIYGLWVAVVSVLWVVPASRRRIRKPHYVLVGGAAVYGFFELAQFLQRPFGAPLVLIGAAGLTALACVMGWLVYAGFRAEKEPGVQTTQTAL